MFKCMATITLGLFMATLAVAPITQNVLDQSNKAEALGTFGKLPMSFEANEGQAEARVKFLSRGNGYRLFLTASEAVLHLSAKTSYRPGLTFTGSDTEDIQTIESAVLRMQWVGASPQPQAVGLNELPGKVNYFLGDDPQKWRTNIPTYAKVKYEAVYPGIDLVYYGNQHQLEYDLVLAPSADPKTITLGFEGADQLALDAQGDLVLHTAGGQIRLQKPLVYQETEGVRQEIPGGYVLLPGPEGVGKGESLRQVGFQVGAYDTARPLVIDPVLIYSTYLGGSVIEWGRDIAVDAEGSAYVVGATGSPDFPTAHPVQPDFRGPTEQSEASGLPFDVFVAKMNATGTALVYATYLGGSNGDEGLSIAVDAEGNAYVMGGTRSPDFPTAEALQPIFGGSGPLGGDAFVAKLNPTGSALVYATYMGGSAGEDLGSGGGIAVDAAGNAYVTGTTTSNDFPTANPVQPACGGESDLGDAFVAKVDATGSAFVFATCLGGSGRDWDWGRDIAVDAEGNAYVMGGTASSDFPTVNPLQPKHGGDVDIFVAKMNPTGSALVYATYLGGDDADYAYGGIAVDTEGNAYLTGSTNSGDFPMVNPMQPKYGGENDIFVAKINPTGSALVYSTYLGGSRHEGGSGIAVDADGSAYVTGPTYSPDFPTANPVQPGFGGGVARGIEGDYTPSDAFVVKMNPSGGLLFSTYLGGTGDDSGSGIAVDAAGSVYVTGDTLSLDFPTVNPIQSAKAGPSLLDAQLSPPDAFVVKIAGLPAATATPIFPAATATPIPGWLLVGLLLGVVATALRLVWRRRLWRRMKSSAA